MNLIPAKIGAENKKKVAVLGGLVAVLVSVVIWNMTSSSSDSPAAPPTRALATASKTPPATVPEIMPPQRTSRPAARSVDDFRPTLKLPEKTDVSKIDPTLKLELLAKVKKVEMEGGVRSLFDFGQPPPPPPPKVDPIKPGEMTVTASKGANGKPPEPPKPAGPPPPPPIPLKFFGYSTRSGSRRAFFMNGDDIFVAGENELIQNRYKVIKIGVNSAVVEDTTDHHQQTLKLVEEVQA